MLKMYKPSAGSGATSEFWDANWDQAGGGLSDDHANDRYCESLGSVFRILRATVRPDRLFLEGGCGPGHWVRYFHARGCRVVGVDFASRTVERLKRRNPELDVRIGNVNELPFADGEVHTYYSGGVVEHFEDGPERALREARRVLSPDGWFLCSVPDASTLRDKLLYRGERTSYSTMDPPFTVRRVDATRTESDADGKPFFQYLFTQPEFSALLADAGFVVERTFGYSLLWGLAEIPYFTQSIAAAGRVRRLLSAMRRSSPAVAVDAAPSATTAAPATEASAGLLRRALFAEDLSVPLLGPLVGVALEHASNMRMYVARPRRSA